MKNYPLRDHERDHTCECGHKANDHETGWLLNLFTDRLFTGKCTICLCPKFKDEAPRGMK